MNIGWCTDIHLDIAGAKQKEFLKQLESLDLDALMITGDISESPTLCEDLHKLAQTTKRLFFVLGNHDYYQGSLLGTRTLVEDAALLNIKLNWLASKEPIKLNMDTCITGVDGWADAIAGEVRKGFVLLNDWTQIEDLKLAYYTNTLSSKYAELARNEATLAQIKLNHAKSLGCRRIIFATHVPPWVEATWHGGKTSEEAYLPWYTNVTLGSVLSSFAIENPDINIQVYCGHTHGAGEAHILHNVTVHTGASQLGSPSLCRVISV